MPWHLPGFFEGFLMLIPHEKCPPRVAQTGLLLLVMQYRFFWKPKTASQVTTFQTQTFLHLIGKARQAPVVSVVRLGNVFGSSGSVVPLFLQQAQLSGTVTVTDENMYQMHIISLDVWKIASFVMHILHNP